jgi:hypothetical protein
MLRNAECHSLQNSLNFIKTVRSIRLLWIGHVAPIKETGNVYRIFGQDLGKRSQNCFKETA